jgi:hypothetical protein
VLERSATVSEVEHYAKLTEILCLNDLRQSMKLNTVSNLNLHVYSLRGTGGDLVLLEEAAFIPQEVWLEVVIPLIVIYNFRTN